MGLKDAALSVKRWIDDDASIEGRFTAGGNPAKKLIEVAMGRLPDGLSDEKLAQKLGEIVDHEVVHWLKEAGVFAPKEWDLLAKYAKGRMVEGQPYTYLQRAEVRYEGRPYDEVIEEAVADAFRDFMKGDLKPSGAQRSFMQRIFNFFRRITDWLSPTSGGRKVMEQIRSGEIGRRSDGYGEVKKNNQPTTRLSRYTRDEFNKELNNGDRSAFSQFSEHDPYVRMDINEAKHLTPVIKFIKKEMERIVPGVRVEMGVPHPGDTDLGYQTDSLKRSSSLDAWRRNNSPIDNVRIAIAMLNPGESSVNTGWHEAWHVLQTHLSRAEFTQLYAHTSNPQILDWINKYKIRDQYRGQGDVVANCEDDEGLCISR